jgi:hypothetical protein
MSYKTPFVWHEGRACPDPRLVDLLNLPAPIVYEWLAARFPPGSLKHKILVSRAYDNAHDTHHSDEYSIFNVDQELPWAK